MKINIMKEISVQFLGERAGIFLSNHGLGEINDGKHPILGDENLTVISSEIFQYVDTTTVRKGVITSRQN